jgi:hypothetical protein
MRSVWVFKRSLILVLGTLILCALLLQTPVGSQSLFNNEPDRSRAALGRSFQAHATASDRGVLVEWRTGFEPDNLGFNVYRVSNGQRTQLNSGLIAGSAFITRQQTSPDSYAWLDAGGNLASEYRVEAVDVRGQVAVHDAIKPARSASLPDRPQSELLANLGSAGRAATKQDEFSEAPQNKTLQTSAEGIAPATISDQWSIANQPALKIGVRADGWYRITQAELAAAGFSTSGDARNLRLFVGGNEIAMRTSRDSGALTSADYVEFWGQGLDLSTTDTQVYWLVNGAQAGKRIAIAGELNTNTLPPSPITSSPGPIVTTNPPAFWFGGVTSAVSGDDRAEGGRQKAQGSQQKSVSSSPVRVRGERSARKDAGEAQAKVPALQSVPPTVAREPVRAGTNLRFKIQDSRPETNSKLDPKTSRLRKHRRHRIRSLGRRNHTPSRRRNHARLALAAAPNFIYNVQRKDRILYYTAALNGEQENFFGPIVVANTATAIALTLNNIETTSAATAQVTVALQGVSFITHQVNVLVNDMPAGTISFFYQDPTTQTFSIPVAWLVEGNNTVKLQANPGNDTTLVDYVRISYPHRFRADNDSLKFNVKSTLGARIDGFTSANIRVLDISDPANVQLVRPVIETSGAGYALTIQPNGRTKGRSLVALPATQFSTPASLVLNTPSTLNATANNASLVIISYKDFLPALDTLVAQRQAQGFVVRKIDVEDVFDEFSYGVHTPQAIRDFLSYTQASWSPPKPSYVLLVGDASFDPRNYQGFGNFDFVPTKLIDTGFRGDATALETASDDWLTDFGNDGIADISIGRLPVRTLAEANLVVAKIVNYAPTNAPQSALLVADTQGSYYFNFEAADDQIVPLLPPSLTIQKVYRRLAASDAAAKQDIINKFNSGQVLVIYSGHGNVDIWGGSIFSTTDAMALTNGNKLPFVVVMDCLNGYFTDARLQSLAESLVKAPNGGAVASFASSGLTIPDGQHFMGQKMFELLYPANGSTIPIGDASRQSKIATADLDVRRTWILFGDPTMEVR